MYTGTRPVSVSSCTESDSCFAKEKWTPSFRTFLDASWACPWHSYLLCVVMYRIWKCSFILTKNYKSEPPPPPQTFVCHVVKQQVHSTCLCVCRLIMSDEKDLFQEKKEEVELLKNEPSSMEEEEMAEKKPVVERSKLMISCNTSLLYQWWGCSTLSCPEGVQKQVPLPRKGYLFLFCFVELYPVIAHSSSAIILFMSRCLFIHLLLVIT